MTKISERLQKSAEDSLNGVFISEPVVVRAFQWEIGMKTQDFPAWFRKMTAEGKASVTVGGSTMTIEIKDDVQIGTKTVDKSTKNKLHLSNKRGNYFGLPGDWVVSDEYGHIFIVSQKTFPERYKTLNN
jgi:hypothetical protein